MGPLETEMTRAYALLDRAKAALEGAEFLLAAVGVDRATETRIEIREVINDISDPDALTRERLREIVGSK